MNGSCNTCLMCSYQLARPAQNSSCVCTTVCRAHEPDSVVREWDEMAAGRCRRLENVADVRRQHLGAARSPHSRPENTFFCWGGIFVHISSAQGRLQCMLGRLHLCTKDKILSFRCQPCDHGRGAREAASSTATRTLDPRRHAPRRCPDPPRNDAPSPPRYSKFHAADCCQFVYNMIDLWLLERLEQKSVFHAVMQPKLRLRLLSSSGAPLRLGLLRRLAETLQGCRILNLYGCTEASGDSTWLDASLYLEQQQAGSADLR